MNDSTHLGGRFADSAGADADADGAEFDHWGGPRVPRHVRVLHDAWAMTYAGMVRSGDTGTAVAYLHQLRHDPPEGFDVWRFLDAVAARLTRKDR